MAAIDLGRLVLATNRGDGMAITQRRSIDKTMNDWVNRKEDIRRSKQQSRQAVAAAQKQARLTIEATNAQTDMLAAIARAQGIAAPPTPNEIATAKATQAAAQNAQGWYQQGHFAAEGRPSKTPTSTADLVHYRAGWEFAVKMGRARRR